MECRINRERIKDAIQSKIINILTESGFSYYEGVLAPTEQDISVVDYVNSIFQENVVNQDFEINISEELVDAYMSKYQNIVSNQEEDLFSNPTKVSVTTPAMVRINRFLDQAGVQVESLENISMNGQNLGVEGIALPLQALIQHVSTAEDSVLTEEAMHIAVELISQKDKSLFDAMMSKITSYPIYGETFRQYKDLEAYQTNGKPNITKIKKEAIGKLLTQAIVNNQEIQEPKSWWAKVKSYLKGLFSPLKQEINDFNQAISTIFDGDLGTIRDTLLQSKEYLVENGFDSEQADRVINLAQSDITDYELRIAMGNMQIDLAYYKVTPTIERKAQNIKAKSETITYNGDGTYTVNGKKLTYSDILEAERALSKTLSKSSPDYNTILRNIEDNYKSEEASIINDVLKKYLNSDGTASTTPIESLIKGKGEKYERIARQVIGKINEFPQGSVFIPQAKVEDGKAAATIDLLVIDNNEIAHLINFQAVQGEISREESKALKAKLETAKQILGSKTYNVNNFGQIRTIVVDKEVVDGLSDEYDYPRPIVSESETIGSPVLDLIYNAAYTQRTKSNVRRPLTLAEMKQNKVLNGVVASYQTLQVRATVTPIVNQMKFLTSYMKELTEEFNTKYKGKKDVNYSAKEVRDLISQMAITMNLANTMSNTTKGIAEFNKNRGTKVDTRKLSASESDLKEQLSIMEDSVNSLVDQFSNTKYQIFGITAPEIIQSFLPKSLRTASQQTQTTIQVLTRLAEDSTGKAEIRHSNNITKIAKIKEDVLKLAQKLGIDPKDSRKLIAPITQQGKDGYIHRLIKKLDDSFYEQAKKARETGDIEWVRNNIDMKAYDKFFQERKALQFYLFDTTVESYNEEITNEEMRELRKQEWLDTYDLSRGINPLNRWILQFPIESKFYSKEYQNLLKKENKPYLDLYNMFQELNDRAVDMGIISDFEGETFLPEVKASFLERAFHGKKIRLKDLVRDIREGREEYVAYGEYTPVSSNRTIPFNMAYRISKRRINEEGEVVSDYSEVSTDIFSLLGAYSGNIEVYNTLSQTEYLATLIRAVEANKPSLSTDKTSGQASDTPQRVENITNLENFDKFLGVLYYGVKYDDDVNGIVKLNITNNVNKALNKAFKTDFKTDYPVVELPLRRVLDNTRDYFILKTLGANPATAITNMFGTHIQGVINSGQWFTKAQFEGNNFKLFQEKLTSMTGKEKSIRLGLLDYFISLTDGESNVEASKRLTLSKLGSLDLGNNLMYLLKKSDMPVQWAIGTSFLQNTIVQDGKLINVREYLRGQDKYIAMYNGTTQQIQDLKKEFETEVESLLKEKGLMQVAKFGADGLLEIPGIDRDSDTVVEIRRKIQQLTKDSTGMGTTNEYRPINASFFMRNLMTFFSWAPRLIEQRFAGTRRTGSFNAIEQGRVLTFANAINKQLFESGTNLLDLIKLSERGVESIKEEFQKTVDKYEKRTGKQYYERGENEERNRAIAERDFIEMYQRNVKNASLEFTILFTTLGMLMTLVHFAPDDDDELKGVHKYATKIARKILGELSFYYNPLSIKDLTGGKILPAMNVVNDGMKFAKATAKELWGTEEQQRETPWLGKTAKLIPGIAQIAPIFSVFSQDLAKEFDYVLPEATVFEPPRNN